MKLTTSTKISVKFTLFTIAILLLLGIAINGMFFGFWWKAESIKLTQWFPLHDVISSQNNEENNIRPLLPPEEFVSKRMRKFLPRGAMPKNEVKSITSSDSFAQRLHSSALFAGLSFVDDEWYLFLDEQAKTSYTSVQSHIDLQELLFWSTIWLILGFGIASYFLSLFFVKNSLYGLQHVVDFVKDLHFDDLHKRIPLSGPEQDEIRIVAYAINEFLDKLQYQSQALKDFVSHASHELKTPLMTISSTIDYIRKAKQYDAGLQTIKSTVGDMHTLIANLLLLAKLESQQSFDTGPHFIAPIVSRVASDIAHQYEAKHIIITLSLDETVKKSLYEPAFELIIKNLIDNAYKYTLAGGTIHVFLDTHSLRIQDSGIGIDAHHLPKVWDKFWKEDTSRQDTKSFGLGLSLVKMLVDRHGWCISVESKKNKGSTFTLLFAHESTSHRG